MATIIKPGAYPTSDWDDVIPVKVEDDWRIVNDALMLVAAWMTRGGRKPNQQLFGRIMYGMVGDDIPRDDEYTGKFAFYLRKVIETKPKAWRE